MLSLLCFLLPVLIDGSRDGSLSISMIQRNECPICLEKVWFSSCFCNYTHLTLGHNLASQIDHNKHRAHLKCLKEYSQTINQQDDLVCPTCKRELDKNQFISRAPDYWNYLNYVLAIPNWVIPSLLTMDKAFIMTLLQFVLRIPRDFRSDLSLASPLINVIISFWILVQNSLFLLQTNIFEGEGTMPSTEQIGFMIGIPMLLDTVRWLRWESELRLSRGHFVRPFKVQYKEIQKKFWILGFIMHVVNWFMPIFLQPTYYGILFGFLFFQYIRKLEIETVSLLFFANIAAGILEYNPNPDAIQIWSILGIFAFLGFIVCFVKRPTDDQLDNFTNFE